MGTDTRNAKNCSHAGHRRRMRERFSHGGFDNYRPHEVLEQILFGVLPRVNTNEIAHSLLESDKTLMDVLYADREELVSVYGIGERSAEYIMSIVPKVTDAILSQYRELGELNIYNIAFLGDWFLCREPSDRIAIVLCDSDKKFTDLRYLEHEMDGEFIDPYKTGEMIAKVLGCDRYYIIGKKGNSILTRSSVLVLRDYTSRLGSFMCDAYLLDRFRPVSLLYNFSE